MELACSLEEMQANETFMEFTGNAGRRNWHVVYRKFRQMKLACSLQEMQADEIGM